LRLQRFKQILKITAAEKQIFRRLISIWFSSFRVSGAALAAVNDCNGYLRIKVANIETK